ncbi:MAG: AAA family ATPase [Candidatus Aenigmarchaeota archaeon]|nr:AAA family ATPase [Candidatus Aenigmarchaeota archaeon]
MRKVISVVSGKGGVGKTTTAANLALALQEFGEKVIAIDCDLAGSNLALHLDLHPNPEKSLQSVLEGKRNVLDAIAIHKTGLMVLPSSHVTREDVIDPGKFKRVLSKLDGVVIIDAPPGLTQNLHTIISLSDEIIVVTNPEIPAVADAMKVVEVIKEKKKTTENTWCVVTKSDEIKQQLNDTEIEMALEVPIVSKIPYDKFLKRSIFERVPVVRYNPYAPSSIEYRKLAAWLVDKRYEPPKIATFMRFIQRLRR